MLVVNVTRHNHDDPFYEPPILEECVKCKSETRYWWGNGCMPLCQLCASIVTDEWCHEHAKREGYGPLPK